MPGKRARGEVSSGSDGPGKKSPKLTTWRPARKFPPRLEEAASLIVNAARRERFKHALVERVADRPMDRPWTKRWSRASADYCSVRVPVEFCDGLEDVFAAYMAYRFVSSISKASSDKREPLDGRCTC